MDFNPFLFKKLFLDEVKRKGTGMVNCHTHLDRAFTLTETIWAQAMELMERKWILMRDIKKAYTENTSSLKKRLKYAVKMMSKQGVTACRSHADIDSIVGMKVVETFSEMREKYKGKFTLQITGHPLEGFLNDEGTAQDKHKIELFEKGCALCDVVGALPSRDRRMQNGDKKHLDVIFGIAKNLKKPVDVHIDQENNPQERDTEMLIQKIKEHKYQGKVNFLHVISLSAQPLDYQQKIIAEMKDIGAMVTTCPRAAIGMKQHEDKLTPCHNSIAPVPKLLEAGIPVGIGTDNISDIFMPEENGDIFEGIDFLACACRYYLPEKLAEIAVTNGHKILDAK